MYTAEEIVKKFTDLQTLPHVAIKVNQLVNSSRATMNDFEEIIKVDPILVSRLLKLVNSSYFSLVNKVDSISKAVAYLGMKNLRNLVAVESLRNMFKDEGDNAFSRTRLWLHSATVSIAAEMISKRVFGKEGEDLFLAGILHDIGMIAEDQVAGEELRKACEKYQKTKQPLILCEQEFIGTDHCEVGKLLVSEWKLSKEIMRSIAFHHEQEKQLKPSSITGIIQLAEYISGRVNASAINGKAGSLPPYLVRHVKKMIGNYKLIVRDLPGEMAKAKELYEQDE
jgi:putative nucleotidyltransferase with HDIG domain